jgi:hypothetical protein
MKQVRKLASIEIMITAITGQYNWPNNNFLNGKTITALWLPDNTEGNVIAPSGNDAVTNDAIFNANLTIRKDGSDAVVLQVPLCFFLESWYGGDRTVRPLNIDNFNPGTTFINFTDTGNLSVGESILMMVEYIDC